MRVSSRHEGMPAHVLARAAAAGWGQMGVVAFSPVFASAAELWLFFGYFSVLGQINRHGWLFTVAVNFFTFWPLSFRSGPSWLRSARIAFSLSDDSRKFCSVI